MKMEILGNIKKLTKNKLITVFSLVVISIGIIGGCGGSNPPFAPFNSTITILTESLDLLLPPNTIVTESFEAIVLGPEGLPLNGVRVRWDLGFAGLNDFVLDSDGDGIADSNGIQFFDPDACGNIDCELLPIPQIFAMGGFVESPYETVTDDRGISTIAVLISGDTNIISATLTASTMSGSIDTLDITLGGVVPLEDI